MALFGKKKKEQETGEAAGDPSGNGTPEPNEPKNAKTGDAAKRADTMEFSPAKARKFFDFADTLHQQTNYDYAVFNWLQGLRQDPNNWEGFEGFVRSISSLNASGVKPSKETRNAFGSARSQIERYLSSLLAWGFKPKETELSLRAAEQASELGLSQQAVWLAERGLISASEAKRPVKKQFTRAMEVFSKCDRPDRAVQAGELAIKADPTDSTLAAQVRNFSADATMSKGGFDDTGESGGFRKNIRDAEKQRQLEEEKRAVVTEEVVARRIAAAKAAYEETPDDKPALKKYVDELLKRGTPEDQATVIELAEGAYQRTQEFRFREIADNVRLRQAKARLAEAKHEAEQPNAPDEAKARYRNEHKAFLSAYITALEAQVHAYPTDLGKKYQLGRALYEAERFEECIAYFQEAKGDVKRRAEILGYLAKAFARIDFVDESIETLRQALEAHHSSDDKIGLDLRYELMAGLAKRAESTRGVEDVEEAYKLSSAIAMAQFNFRDIKEQRERIKLLRDEIKGL